MLFTTFICLFISILYSNQVYEKQQQLQKVICQWLFVCVLCHSLKYFFPRMAFPSVLQVVPKYFLSPTMVAAFGKH